MIATLHAHSALRASAQDCQADWRALNANTLGAQTYIYTFPWSYMTEQRWTRSADVGHEANRLFHFQDLKDGSHADGGSPTMTRCNAIGRYFAATAARWRATQTAA